MMESTPNRQNLHKIVIINPKGGSGKTTLATNLASYFAAKGPPPTLADCDPQGYSIGWLTKRPPDRPKVHGLVAYEHCNLDSAPRDLEARPGSEQLIVDLPASLPDHQLHHHIYDADSVLIPVVPSEIDIYSATRFIASLLLVAQFDRRNRNLAIVANRTRANTRSYGMLMRFLTSLDIPMIAKLRDSQNFVYAAAEGIGIDEMPAYRVRKDIEQFHAIVEWLQNWRMRKLDAAASADFRHVPGAEILTPPEAQEHH